jgi:hypothetical protein
MVVQEKKGEKGGNVLDILFKEAFSSIKADIRLTLMLLVFFILLALVSKLILKVNIPFFVFIILFVWTLIYISHNQLIKYRKNREELYSFHFRNNFIDLILVTSVIHYLGGVDWIGGIFYLFCFAWTTNSLSKKRVMILYFSAISFYSILVSLEYFQIISHISIFGLSPGYFQNPAYIIIQIFSLAAVLFFLIENYGTFSKTLKKQQEGLIRSQEEIEEARKVLEIKVMARTRELQDLTEKQEDIIEERSKESRERVEELEKFQKLSIGRELKMIELKEEIKELKNQFGVPDNKNNNH